MMLERPEQSVKIVTSRPLDRETTSSYELVVRASDKGRLSHAEIRGRVLVSDENDNVPIFEHAVYEFELAPEWVPDLVAGGTKPQWKRFSSIGKVLAKDADGDKVAYRLGTPNNLVVLVPQTGELLLAGEPFEEEESTVRAEFIVEAHESQNPTHAAATPARIIVRFLPAQPDEPTVHRVQKRRVTRAVRPTKKVDFTEADGDTEGKIVFGLDKETDKETYKIRDDNKWVTVASNGSVMVKTKWDYEDLGPEKTIDFWVTISNTGNIELES